MVDRAFFERLPTTADRPDELFEHFEAREFDGLTYHALSDARHGVDRGTVVVPEADVVVCGYPSIPRILNVGAGAPAFFEEHDEVVVEEKLDGFNVRIADVDGEVLAFTRSGYVGPYATPRATELLDLDEYFGDHPETVLCGELLGPETPYTTHDYDDIETNEIRLFGIRDRESGDPVPIAERRRRCEQYDFPQPRHFGACDPTDAPAAVQDAIDELDAARREGVVLKSPDATATVKYTTESQHRAELAYAFSLPFDYGRDFLFSRIVREAFQAAEFDAVEGDANEDDDARLRERAHDLGESILLPMVETIHDVEADEPIGERKTVRASPETIDALLDHLHSQGLTLEVERDETRGDERVVEFVKLTESTRDRTQYYLDGGTRDE